MRLNLSILCLLIIGTILNSCRKDPETFSLDQGYNYFPLDSGNWWVYEVDSVFYNSNYNPVRKDSFHFQIREVIDNRFTDLEKRDGFKIIRFKREDSLSGWVEKDVWWAVRDSKMAERSEENVRFVKLTFPLSINKTWNGNSRNSLGRANYKIQTLDAPYNQGNLKFDSTLSVLQMDEENLIENKYSIEVYSKNIGMIFKDFRDIKTNIDGSIKSGIVYNYKLTSSGKK